MIDPKYQVSSNAGMLTEVTMRQALDPDEEFESGDEYDRIGTETASATSTSPL